MALKNFPNDASIDNAIPPVAAAREDAGEPLRKETNEVLKDIRDATQERFAEVDSDSRWTDAREWSETTITKVDAEEGTSTERKAWTAQRVRQAVAAFFNQATSTFTRTLLSRTSATQVRADLELGDSATRSVGTASGTVAAGNDSRLTGALQKAELAGTTGQGTNTALTQKAASDKFASVEGDITALENGLQNKVDKEAGKGLSDENYTAAEKSKLAGLQGSKWKGKFVSLAALQSGVATPTAGDYADVDSGVGSDIKRYIYDATDAKWVEQSGVVADLTGAQIKALYEAEPDTNAFSDSDASKLAALPSNQTLTGLLANKVDKETGKGLIEPAPVNGKQYSRKDNAWVEVTGDVEEAPLDGKQYARKDAAWEEVAGDVEEAPLDGGLYLRSGGAWQRYMGEKIAYVDYPLESGISHKFTLADFPDTSFVYQGTADGEYGDTLPYRAEYMAAMQSWVLEIGFRGDTYKVAFVQGERQIVASGFEHSVAPEHLPSDLSGIQYRGNFDLLEKGNDALNFSEITFSANSGYVADTVTETLAIPKTPISLGVSDIVPFFTSLSNDFAPDTSTLTEDAFAYGFEKGKMYREASFERQDSSGNFLKIYFLSEQAGSAANSTFKVPVP